MPKVSHNTGRLVQGPMSDGEKNDILVALAKPNATIQSVAKEFGRDPSTVSRLVAQFRPTTALAKATLLSRVNEMVERVIEKADIDQLIDVLSRPNVGVLDPIAKSTGGGGGPNILVSVNAGSLAAANDEYVKNVTPPALPEASVGGKSIQVGSVKVAEYNQ